MTPSPRPQTNRSWIAFAILILWGGIACALQGTKGIQYWWKDRGPVVPHASFPADCSICHTSQDWTTLRADFAFDHEEETGYPLEGAHAEAQCLRCHNDRGPVQNFSQRGCAGCHGDVHQQQLGDRCLDCHQQRNWQASGQIAEHARTRFPLFGAHAVMTCDRCHVGIGSGNMEPLSVECNSCHQPDLARAVPNHFQEGWVENCDRCHRPTSWAEEGFIHDSFPLVGGHQVSCASCHAQEVFNPVSSDCNDCHQAQFTVSTSLDHVAFNLPRSCDRCHTVNAWSPSAFDHSVTQNDCADCHVSDFLATQNPNHSLWGYSQDCISCHKTTRWDQIIYSHAGVVDNCSQCHLQDYANTSDPNHTVWGYPTSCELCHHQTNSFPPADFMHIGVVDGCIQCHGQDYLMTTDPDHVASGFPTDCQLCHVPDTSWRFGPGPRGSGLRTLPPGGLVEPRGNTLKRGSKRASPRRPPTPRDRPR